MISQRANDNFFERRRYAHFLGVRIVFYDTFSSLCSENGVTPNKACVDCNISRTSVAKWKKGATPNGTTLAKIADYFGVTTDCLLGNEKTPTPEGEREFSDNDLMFALWGDSEDIDDDDLDDVKRYAAFVRERKKKNEK